MDLTPTILVLRLELERVEKAIAQLEQFENGTGNGSGDHHRKKRGRKSMGSEERLAVSERMKHYWASRNKT